MPDPKLDLEISIHTALTLLGQPAPVQLTVKPYAGLTATAELQDGSVSFRASEAWALAPEEARVGLALYLLSHVLRRRPDARARPYLKAYRAFQASEASAELHDSLRRRHGRGSGTTPKGKLFDLEAELERVLLDHPHVFDGHLPAKPKIAWSRHHSRSRLGYYDSAFNTLVISKGFDRPRTPASAVRSVIYHELLHIKHKVQYERGRTLRRTVHPRAFKEDEKRFLERAEADAWFGMRKRNAPARELRLLARLLGL
jgi:hypothetical protein